MNARIQNYLNIYLAEGELGNLSLRGYAHRRLWMLRHRREVKNWAAIVKHMELLAERVDELTRRK